MLDFLRILRSRRMTAFFGALAVLGALVLSGCGGGDDDFSAPTITRYTFADYTSTVSLAGGGTGTLVVHVDSGSQVVGTLSGGAGTTSGSVLGLITSTNDGTFTASGTYTSGGTTVPVTFSGTFPQRTEASGGTVTWTVNGATYTSAFTVTPTVSGPTI